VEIVHVLALEPIPPLKEREPHQNVLGARKFVIRWVVPPIQHCGLADEYAILVFAYSMNNDIETTYLRLGRG
jgi:hypothetical protein